MEWAELRVLWQQQDARITENIRINKEILKRMIRKNPEKRLKWMKFWAVYGIVIPIPIFYIVLIHNPDIKFRNEWDFYLGIILLIVMLAHSLYQTTKYFLLIRNVDFTNQVAKTKKQLVQLEKFRLKWMKGREIYLSFLIGLAGICLVAQLPVLTIKFALFTIFIIIFSIIANNIHAKRFKNQMNSFNAELNEIEQLETE